MTEQTILLGVIVMILLIAMLAIYKLGKCRGSKYIGKTSTHEGYLVYPYLDLDEPGERGNYYAMSEVS